MAVLVTGGAGYIGSHTAKCLVKAGYKPVVFDNLVFGHEWAAKYGPLVKGDLQDADLIRTTIREHKIDSVIHFAAYAYVGESVTQPKKYFRNNFCNTQNLLDAMVECGVKTLVFSSTCATYGNPIEVPISESHPQNPINPYGESKLMVEKMLKWYDGAYGLKWAALRYFNAAGADPEGEIGEDHDPETHLIPLIVDAALGKRPNIGIFGTDYPTPDGTAVRDYIHVNDLADAHIRAQKYLQKGGQSVALNLGTGKGNSVREVIAAVERVSGNKVPVKEQGRRAGDPPALVANASKANEVLGWKPQYASIDTIVEHAWKWHTRQSR
jgi:UDP-arabinose 4-epimerase